MGGCITDANRPIPPHTKPQAPSTVSLSVPSINPPNPTKPPTNKNIPPRKIEMVTPIQHHKINNLKPIIKPVLPTLVPDPNTNPHLADKITPSTFEYMEIKVPKDLKSWTEFQWIKQPVYEIPAEIESESAQFMKTRSFQQKYRWFRGCLQRRRISWSSGKSEELHVDRSNLLMSSNTQFQQINFHKQVKVVFGDEKEASDAGGLIREWMNLCIDEIFNPELGLFKLCDTKETFYKFNYNENVQELFEVAARILGVVIGKAIFQRIPLKCFLNYTILRQICGQPIQMNDIFTFDSDFYRGWTFLVENTMITGLEQNFCVYEFDDHGQQITIPLKEEGFNCMVNSNNKEEYVSLLCQHYCTKSIVKLMENLRYGIYKIIPPDLLSIFQPHELDMIINGRKSIDVHDLKSNTKYTDCNPDDELIEWFWQHVEGLSQEKLEHVLHFVTGNGRVPILGFKYLQSNRGQFRRFQIKLVPYNQSDPYPKSHTCFNRLELPRYPDIDCFLDNIVYISVENKYFGLQ